MVISLKYDGKFTVNIHSCDEKEMKKHAIANSAEIETLKTESGIRFNSCAFSIGKITIRLFS